jgi:hypothetical protein
MNTAHQGGAKLFLSSLPIILRSYTIVCAIVGYFIKHCPGRSVIIEGYGFTGDTLWGIERVRMPMETVGVSIEDHATVENR